MPKSTVVPGVRAGLEQGDQGSGPGLPLGGGSHVNYYKPLEGKGQPCV